MRGFWWLGVAVAVGLGAVGCGSNPEDPSDAQADAGTHPVASLDESRSTVAVTGPASVVADGLTPTTVTATLIDTLGNPMAGVAVELAVSGDGVLSASTGRTDAKGQFSSALSASHPGEQSVRVIAQLPAGPTPLLSQATVHFVAGAPAQLAFTVVPLQGRVGGSLSPGVEVTVEDAWGNRVSGSDVAVSVSLDEGPGGALLLGTLSRTAVDGVARFDDLTPTRVGNYLLSAKADGLPQASTGLFAVVAGLPSPLQSSLYVDWSGVADGVSGDSFTATLVDGFGNPCIGIPVSVTATGSDNQLDPVHGLTDGTGRVAGTLRSTHAEDKVLSVSADGLTLSAQLHLSSGPVDPGHSTFSLSSAPVTADGTSRAVLTATLADAFGNVVGNSVTVSMTDPATQQYTYQYLYPNQAGQISTYFTSTVAGHRDISLSQNAGPVPLGGIDFVPGPAAQLHFAALPSAVYAGEDTSLSVMVTDVTGNVIPTASDAITLSVTGGTSHPALTGSLTQAAVTGSAHFDGLKFDRSSQGLRFTATAGTLQGNSDLFDVSTWRRLGPNGGSILSVFFLNSDSQFLVGGTGGVFKSVDRGTTYVSSSKGLTGLKVVSLASAGGQGRVFAVTADDGVFLTTDAGATWSPRRGGLTTPDTRSLVTVSSGTYLLGTAAGVFKSSDAGGSWVPVNEGLTDLDVRSVLTLNNVQFAATGSGKVFKTFDQGGHWVDAGVDLGGPATALSLGSSSRVYAASLGGGAYLSDDLGVTWSPVGGLPSQEIEGFYARNYQEVFAVTADAGVLHSTDNGLSWIPYGSGVPATAQTIASPSTYSNVLLIGTTRGLYLSTDSGADFLEADHGLAATTVWDLARESDASPAMWISTDDGVFRTEDGLSWNDRSGGLPFVPFIALQVDPSNPSLAYTAGRTEGVFKTTDGGQSWAPANVGLPTGAVLVSLELSPSNPSTLYALTADAQLFQSTDGAASWAACGPVGATQGTALAVDRTLTGHLYVGTEDAGLRVSTDDGATWSAATMGSGAPTVHALQSVPGKLYAATPEGAFVSTDAGASWSALAALSGDVLAVGADPSAPGVILAATSSGVLRSDDGGATAALLAGPLTQVHGFVFPPAEPGVLYAETTGSGLLRSASGGL